MAKVLLVALGAVLGAVATWLGMDGGGSPAAIQTPPADEAPAKDEPAAPELKTAGTPPAEPAKTKPAAPMPAGSAERLRQVSEQLRAAFVERDREQQSKIRALEAKVERLEATAPEPAILDNLRAASLEELEGLLREVRDVVGERLLTVPARVTADYAAFLGSEGAGAARLLPRGKYEKLIEQRGGGAYWSFKTGSNSYDEQPDLSLEHDHYRSGFYGGSQGYLLDVGDVPIERVGPERNQPPLGLDSAALESWNWMWQEAEAESPRRPDRRKLPGKNPGLRGSVKAVPGHTYVLRAILAGEHDLLVVFRAVESDETGQTLLYRVLREFEMPSRR